MFAEPSRPEADDLSIALRSHHGPTVKSAEQLLLLTLTVARCDETSDCTGRCDFDKRKYQVGTNVVGTIIGRNKA